MKNKLRVTSTEIRDTRLLHKSVKRDLFLESRISNPVSRIPLLTNFKNNKGLVGQILIFIVLLGIVVGFVYATYRIGNQTASEIFFNDDLSTVSLIADAVVNSPSCLLYTESANIGTERHLAAQRGVIDWLKLDPLVKDRLVFCVQKGPFVWKAAVKDSSTNEVREISSGYSDKSTFFSGIPDCNPIGTRSLPVVINRLGSFSQGKATITVGSRDMQVSLKKIGAGYEYSISNSGTCVTEYNIIVSLENTAGQSTKQLFNVKTSGIVPKGAFVRNFALLKASEPYKYNSIKIEASPADLPGYSKTVSIPL